jgi:hypothetical protein
LERCGWIQQGWRWTKNPAMSAGFLIGCSGSFLHVDHFPALVKAAVGAYVMRAADLAAIWTLNQVGRFQRVMGPPSVPAAFGNSLLRKRSHNQTPLAVAGCSQSDSFSTGPGQAARWSVKIYPKIITIPATLAGREIIRSSGLDVKVYGWGVGGGTSLVRGPVPSPSLWGHQAAAARTLFSSERR